jgi:uncharacterized damage-inducible protein DinB
MWEKEIYSTRMKVIHCIKDIPEQKLNWRPSQGKWSIAQNVLHLAGAESRFLTLALTAAESPLKSDSASVDLSVFDDVLIKLKAPTEPSDEPQTLVTLLAALDQSRQLTNNFLETYSKSDLEGKYMDHQRFGIMPIWQVLELLGKHEQRHLHQMQQLKKEILS